MEYTYKLRIWRLLLISKQLDVSPLDPLANCEKLRDLRA